MIEFILGLIIGGISLVIIGAFGLRTIYFLRTGRDPVQALNLLEALRRSDEDEKMAKSLDELG